MTEILIPSVTLVFLIAGFVVLAHLARRDSFAGPGVGHRPVEDLRPAQRMRHQVAAEMRPATNPSKGRTLIA